MPSRYQQLRQAVAKLAAPAEAQVAHLDGLHRPLTGGGSAAGYGNDELALELDDIYHAAGHMLEHGEVVQAEIDAVRPLEEMLAAWSGEGNASFWARQALFTDPRWEQVRRCARQALTVLPDEERPSGWAAGSNG